MRLDNQTPAQALAFRQLASDGSLDCVVSAAAGFLHRQDRRIAFAAEQAPLSFEDVHDGDPHAGALLRQSALVPGKPGTDVTFLGTSFAPGGQAAPKWQAAIRIGARLRKALLVTGPRHWMPEVMPPRRGWLGLRRADDGPVLTGWHLSAPTPARAVEIHWKHAFGGRVIGTGAAGGQPDVHPGNPLGPGLLDLGHGDVAIPVAAHQLDDPNHPVTDWRRHEAEPQGFGLIPPWWRQRQRHVGTYDAAWLETRHPLLPEDFDPRFWQCAHPDMVVTPHLRGDEEYELTNLHPEFPVLRGTLPGVALSVHCADGDAGSAGWHGMALDGLHFDVRDAEARITLIWRARFPLNEAAQAVLTLGAARMDAAAPAQREVAA